MAGILLDMLCLLGIIIVGFLILAAVAVAVYAVLYVIYKFFISTSNKNNGRR